MLKVYKPIQNDIYKAHKLIEYLVNEVWCKAENKPCENKLTVELKSLYDEQLWFKEKVEEIYKVCESLKPQELEDFKNAFNRNNKIKELCERSITPINLNTLNADLLKVIKPFFKKLYIKFLGWKTIKEKYGDKKVYYDALNLANRFNECPCCGYGDLKTFNSKGRSAYDHYLPQKHYPFSGTNFNNLVPICTTCNSDEKGEIDVLKYGKPIFYPFAVNHPVINVLVDVNKKALRKLIDPTDNLKNTLSKSDVKVNFDVQNDMVESWDKIFDIKTRYFGKIADNRVGWFGKVKSRYAKDKVRVHGYTVEKAFDDIIEDDSNDQLGFLKSPYLKSLKANVHLIKAIEEVTGSSIIDN